MKDSTLNIVTVTIKEMHCLVEEEMFVYFLLVKLFLLTYMSKIKTNLLVCVCVCVCVCTWLSYIKGIM